MGAIYIGMAVVLIYGPWPFVLIFNLLLTQGSTWSFWKFGPGFQRWSRSKVWTDRRTTDGEWSKQLILSLRLRWAKKINTFASKKHLIKNYAYLLKFEWAQLNTCRYVHKCWLSGSQCRPWSDPMFFGIWSSSGSTLFVQGYLSQYLG